VWASSQFSISSAYRRYEPSLGYPFCPTRKPPPSVLVTPQFSLDQKTWQCFYNDFVEDILVLIASTTICHEREWTKVAEEHVIFSGGGSHSTCVESHSSSSSAARCSPPGRSEPRWAGVRHREHPFPTQMLIVESSQRGRKNAGAPLPGHGRIPDRR
jgi:hypothetical protein